MSRSVDVKCGSMRDEKISIEHCEFIRHAAFCKGCVRNSDMREESIYQRQRKKEGER